MHGGRGRGGRQKLSRAPAPRALTRPHGAAGGQEDGSGAGAGEVAALVERLLLAKAPMLAEYLSLGAPARQARPGLGEPASRGGRRACGRAIRPGAMALRRLRWATGAAAARAGLEQSRDSVAAGEPALDCLSACFETYVFSKQSRAALRPARRARPGVDAAGRLASLPQLVDGHAPDLDRLPGFVLALARDVDWAAEKPCFRTLAEARARAAGGARPGARPSLGAPSGGGAIGLAPPPRSWAAAALLPCIGFRLGAGHTPSTALSALMAAELQPPSASQAAQAAGSWLLHPVTRS